MEDYKRVLKLKNTCQRHNILCLMKLLRILVIFLGNQSQEFCQTIDSSLQFSNEGNRRCKTGIYINSSDEFEQSKKKQDHIYFKRYFARRLPRPIRVVVGGIPQASGITEQSQTNRLSYFVIRFESTSSPIFTVPPGCAARY